METLGPRIMVNVGTQAVPSTGPNPRDLAPLTNDAFLATFLGKPTLPTTNGISRQPNNFRQPYGTQTDRVTLRSKPRPSAINGESIEPDSAILSIIRGNGSDNSQQKSIPQRQFQGNRRYPHRSFHQQPFISGWNDIPCSPNYRPANGFHRRRRSYSGGAQQQISVVDQMAAQPHIPYAILPKRFEPKQVLNNVSQQSARSSNNKNSTHRHRQTGAPRRSPRQHAYYDDQWEDVDDNSWSQSNARRPFNRQPNRNFRPPTGFHGQRPRTNNYYESYSYGPVNRQRRIPTHLRHRTMFQDNSYVPFNIVPSYDLNEWQGPYARSQRSFNNKRHGVSRHGHNENGFIRDDHRVNNGPKQTRSGTKSTKTTRHRKQTNSSKHKGQQKRRNSRQRKSRNQNSKSEGQATNTNEVKTEPESETTNEDKPKEDIIISTAPQTTTIETVVEEKPLPPRDSENKENESEKPVEQNS